MNLDEIWSKVLDIIIKNVSPVTFGTWFGDTKLIDLTDNTIVLQVPMLVHKKVFASDLYNNLITEAFTEVTGIDRALECYLKSELPSNNVDDIPDLIDINVPSGESKPFETHLNKNLTFENFVVGDTNKFAKTSALAVATSPGTLYNPLFIYGRSGIGKSHLVHAIGNYITEHSPDLKVLYATSDEFRKDYTDITTSSDTLKNSKDFKEKYRNVDVLLIDDIQSLVGAEKTQEEFFHTFNELHSRNKQIIITSDRSPDDLKILEERLRSRFTWGLPVDIYPPDFELRCRIIKDKIKFLNIKDKITDEVIEFIANNCDTDVRRLEGAINRLQIYTTMSLPDIINLEVATEALKDYINKNIYNSNDINTIQKAVADYYKITVEVLKGKKRSANIAYPRMVAMYMCRMMTDQSFPRIGLEFGGRDHSTVIHACDKIEDDLKDNGQLREIINEIKSKM